MKKIILIAIISLSITGLAIGLWSYSNADGDTISICVKKSGLSYVIGEGFRRDRCGKNDTLLTWNISGPQGPKGEKGDKGDPGEKGEQGIQGLNGLNLKVIDADGKEVGLLINLVGVRDAIIWNREIKKTFKIDIDNGLIKLNFGNIESYQYIVFFESNDCSGAFFVHGWPSFNKYTVYQIGTQPVILSEILLSVKVNSFIDYSVNPSQCIQATNSVVDAYKFAPIILPVFNGPFNVIEQ